MKWLGQWLIDHEYIATWLCGLLAVSGAASFQAIKLRIIGWHKAPIVRAALGAVWKATPVAVVVIATQAGINALKVNAIHGGRPAGEVAEAGRERDADEKRHSVAKPVIGGVVVNGKTSHDGAPISSFHAAEIEGFIRCDKCNQLGYFETRGGKQVFVEAELAPEPPKLRTPGG